MKIIKPSSFLLFFIILLFVNNTFAQTNKIRTYKKYTSSQTKNTTYNVNGTKYIYGETYKTTGQPKVERSTSAKQKFLKSKGYNQAPTGYQVDHIIPLSQGGKDLPSNMQLITTYQHKHKTAGERKQASSTYNNNYNPSYNYSNSKSINNSYKTTNKNSIPKTTNRTYNAPIYDNYSTKATKSSYKLPSNNYTNTKTINNSYKTPTDNYSTTKISNSSYKTSSYDLSTPKTNFNTKSYSTGGRRR